MKSPEPWSDSPVTRSPPPLAPPPESLKHATWTQPPCPGDLCLLSVTPLLDFTLSPEGHIFFAGQEIALLDEKYSLGIWSLTLSSFQP